MPRRRRKPPSRLTRTSTKRHKRQQKLHSRQAVQFFMHCMFPFCTARCEVRFALCRGASHLIGGIFVCDALMVNEYVVGALELSRRHLCPQTASKISDAPCGIISRSHKNTPLAYCSDLQYGTMMHQNSIAYLSSSPPSRGTYEPIARPTHISS